MLFLIHKLYQLHYDIKPCNLIRYDKSTKKKNQMLGDQINRNLHPLLIINLTLNPYCAEIVAEG